MSVVFEGVVEMGGQSAENRRLTYAWHLRSLVLYNAKRQKRLGDIFQLFIIIFTFLAVTAAVLYSYFLTQKYKTGSGLNTFISSILLKLNLLLPLVATIFQGINSTLNPLSKSSILKMAAVKIESEIYMYRTKIGRYNQRKNAASNSNNNNSNQASNNNKKEKEKDDSQTQMLNPRKIFSLALESIWSDLNSSGKFIYGYYILLILSFNIIILYKI